MSRPCRLRDSDSTVHSWPFSLTESPVRIGNAIRRSNGFICPIICDVPRCSSHTLRHHVARPRLSCLYPFDYTSYWIDQKSRGRRAERPMHGLPLRRHVVVGQMTSVIVTVYDKEMIVRIVSALFSTNAKTWSS